MTTENKDIEIVIDPRNFKTDADITFRQDEMPKLKLTIGCIDAVDQMEDLLDKFTCLDSEFKLLLWKYIDNFVRSRGYKIVEDGAVVPQ